MRKVFDIGIVIVAFFVICASQIVWAASGGDFTAVYSQAYDSSLNPLGKPALLPLNSYIQIDVRLHFTQDVPGEDFRKAIFDVHGSSGLTPVDLFGLGKWMPPAIAESKGLYAAVGYSFPLPALQSYSQYDSNGGAAGGIESHWQVGNSDAGNDLIAITIEASAMEAANRQYGEPDGPAAGYRDQLTPNGPGQTLTLVGTVLFQATQAGLQSYSVNPTTPFPSTTSWLGIYAENLLGAGTPVDLSPNAWTGSGGSISVVPEPNAFVLTLSAFAGIGLNRRMKRRD